MEQFKLSNKKSVQKSKGLHKTLIGKKYIICIVYN